MSRISIVGENGTDYLIPKRLVFLGPRGLGEVGGRGWAKGFGRRGLGSRGWEKGVGREVLGGGVCRPLQKGHPKKLKKGTGPPNSRPTPAQPYRPTLRPTLFGSDAISRNKISELILDGRLAVQQLQSSSALRGSTGVSMVRSRTEMYQNV